MVKDLSSMVAPYNQKTRKALEAKHLLNPLPPKPHILQVRPPLPVQKDEVLHKSFSKGTSCRRDGLRAQYLLDSMSGVAVAVATDL